MEKKIMDNLKINNSENMIGDPEISEMESYYTISEDEKKSKVDDTSEATPGETVSEESDTTQAEESTEETTDEINSEDVVEDGADSKAEATPGETVSGESDTTQAEESTEETDETSSVEIEMSPEEAAKMAMQTKLVQATYNDIRNDLPEFRSGDTISVGYRVIEGERSRIQSFDGVVIKISAGHGLDKTFTVRKISGGIGVERIFPFHSPNIESIKVLKEGKVRRAKLYYLRSRKGKATRIREKAK